MIGNYTAEDSVGDAAPSPISPEPLCRKDTVRGGRVLDGGDACHVSEGDSPAGVGVGSIELSRDEALDIVDKLRSSAGGESSRDGRELEVEAAVGLGIARVRVEFK